MVVYYWSCVSFIIVHRLVIGAQPFHLLVHLEGDEEESRRRGRATFAEVLPPSSLHNYG